MRSQPSNLNHLAFGQLQYPQSSSSRVLKPNNLISPAVSAHFSPNPQQLLNPQYAMSTHNAAGGRAALGQTSTRQMFRTTAVRVGTQSQPPQNHFSIPQFPLPTRAPVYMPEFEQPQTNLLYGPLNTVPMPHLSLWNTVGDADSPNLGSRKILTVAAASVTSDSGSRAQIPGQRCYSPSLHCRPTTCLACVH